MKIKLFIRENREKHNLSIRDLEQITGIPKSCLSCYENDISYPSFENYIRVLIAFGIHPENDVLKIIQEND